MSLPTDDSRLTPVSSFFTTFGFRLPRPGQNRASVSAPGLLAGLFALLPLLFPAALIFASASAMAAGNTALESCWIEQLRQADNNLLTVLAVKQRCQSERPVEAMAAPSAPVAAPTAGVPAFERGRFNDFFEPYKETYLLTGAMRNEDGSDPFSGKTADIKFRLGMKFRLFPALPAFEPLAPLYFGYSQESWWDVAESSAPFREHNYNPEVFWDYSKTSNRNGLNFVGRLIDQVGYEHQSNGEDGASSRSWDRLYIQSQFQLNDRLQVGIKAWEEFNTGDLNTDITDYLGNIRLNAAFQANDHLTVRANAIQGWETSKISYQLDLVYRIPEWVNSQFMLSYYEGYGEALISYNQKTSSLRAGLYFPISFE
jgi:phospholipase A1